MKRAFALSLGFVFLSPLAFADGEDVPYLTEMVGQNIDMIASQASIAANTITVLTTATNQFNQTTEEWNQLTKTFGMKDSADDQTARLWSADEWESVIGQASGGNNARFQELMQSYSDKYPMLKNDSQTVNPGQLSSTTYQQEGQTYNAALSSSAYTYGDINPRLKKTEDILAKVDDIDQNPNQKSSTDLNSRLLAEQNFNLLELLKTQSIQLQMEATKNQSAYNSDTLDKQFTHYQPTS